MSSTFKQVITVVYLTILVVFSGANVSHDNCPCRISSDFCEAYCDHAELTVVPKCVPYSVQRLDLAVNDFQSIHHGEFERFLKLNYLDLTSQVSLLEHLNNGAFDGLDKLKFLFLDENGLKVLNESLFDRLRMLQKLSISYNELEQVYDYTFTHLESLLYLNLEENNLQYLTRYTFFGLSSLKILKLGSNPLYSKASFPVEVFAPLISLEKLKIQFICSYRSLFNCASMIDEQLTKLPSLRKLYMDVIPYQILGPGFNALKNLEELYLGEGICEVLEIDNTTFENLKNSPIRKLSLKSCNIAMIYPYTFSYMKHMEKLEMNGVLPLCQNGLFNLTSGLHLTNITYLDVSETCITQRPLLANTLEKLQQTNLEYLDLSENQIYYIEPKVLHVLPKSLKYLYLQHNNLEEIDLSYLMELDNILSLYLSNQIVDEHSDLSTKTFQRSSTKSFLESNNRNTTAFITGKQNKTENLSHKFHQRDTVVSKSGVYKTAINIRTLKSRNNDNQNKYLDLPSHLQVIDLSHSNLLSDVLLFCSAKNSLRVFKASYQEPDAMYFLWEQMKYFQMLEELYIGGNSIKHIPEDIFSKQTKLRVLSLKANSLVDVKFDLQPLVDLETLELSENRIQHLSETFTREIDTIAKGSNLTVYLQDNKLFCKCEQLHFVAWLHYTIVIFQKDKLTCEYRNGSELSISRISEIHRSLEAECIASVVIISCAVGFSALLLVLTIIALIYYKRWNFKYLALLGRKNVNPYHPLEDGNVEMAYDIYISYERDHDVTCSETLHEFVTRSIYPELKNRGFNVLIREELDIGHKLYNTISQALRKCKHVVVLLSNDYCNDYWNVFEFNMAVMEGIYTKRQVIIPVALETLNQRYLHEEVFTFLQQGPVASFTFGMNEGLLIDYLSDRVRL